MRVLKYAGRTMGRDSLIGDLLPIIRRFTDIINNSKKRCRKNWMRLQRRLRSMLNDSHNIGDCINSL